MRKPISRFAVLTPFLLFVLLWSSQAFAQCTDNDGDGYGNPGHISCDNGVDEDCDDNDPAVNPGATEVCNGLDDNCNGGLPPSEEDADADGDMACEGDCDDTDADLNLADADMDGYDTCAGDCDDGDDLVNPGATEVCDDGVDNDCDAGTADLFDADGDGSTCDADCDDADATAYPGAVEACDGVDNDCDGAPGPLEVDVDTDGWLACLDCDDDDYFANLDDVDGDGYATCHDDCDDEDASINPGEVEVCDDGVDNDCDETTDETVDADLDGFTICDGDCDDADETVYAGAQELCDGLDNDCDPATDETVDADGDGATTCQGDCDDTNADINGSADEVCNGLDDDCDDIVDDGFDADGDGYLDAANADCEAAYPAEELDCDDADAAIYPLATEVCDDGIDNNCDGLTDGEDEVDCLNEFPIADAGYDQQSRYLAGVVTLRFDGSASYDPEGNSIEYEWAIDEEPAGLSDARLVWAATSPYAFLVAEVDDPESGPWDFSVALRVTELDEEGTAGKQSDPDLVRGHIYIDDALLAPSRCSVSTDGRPSSAALALLGGAFLFVLRRR